jgi:uncharacterized membrane protein required for colicin V production
MAGVNQVDVAALALVLAFAYKGYRTGFIAVLLGLTGGVLAFGLAAVLAPVLAPMVSPVVADRLGVPAVLIRPALVVALTLLLRFVLGYAVRELTSVLRLLVQSVPPLALADRVLGILPAAALGALLALAIVVTALALPRSLGLRGYVDDSWIAQTLIRQPRQTLRHIWNTANRLVTDPPRVNGGVVVAGVAGLGVATVAAGRLRNSLRAVALAEAPARRNGRAALADVRTFEPLGAARAVLGVGIGLAVVAGLLFYVGLQ